MSIAHIAHQRQHSHTFNEGNPLAERSTRRAALLTAVMMVVEIAGGWSFNSMALLADGWHMSSHALALGLSLFAYIYARRHADDPRFTSGTWKIEILGGYTSALLLLGVAGLMVFQSVERLISPQPVHYSQAIAIAGLGLLVNLICAWWLRDSHHHHDHRHSHDHCHSHAHDHSHAHAHGQHEHADLNLRAAYLHVLADAATSVLAIVALACGMIWQVRWMDPAMGIVGAIFVTVWAWGLLRSTSRVLLDAEMDAPVVAEVREVIAQMPHPAEIADLHVWRIGGGKYACILSLVSDSPADADDYRKALQIHEELVHITIELHRPEPAITAPAA